MNKTIQEMLNDIMEKLQINQKKLASMLKVDEAQISRWLTGIKPRIENQRKIKNLYDSI